MVAGAADGVGDFGKPVERTNGLVRRSSIGIYDNKERVCRSGGGGFAYHRRKTACKVATLVGLLGCHPAAPKATSPTHPDEEPDKRSTERAAPGDNDALVISGIQDGAPGEECATDEECFPQAAVHATWCAPTELDFSLTPIQTNVRPGTMDPPANKEAGCRCVNGYCGAQLNDGRMVVGPQPPASSP